VTAIAWLQSRTPSPPEQLTARIADALGTRPATRAGEAADACLDAATKILERILGVESSGRDSAVDLLAADALITYAFELAAEDVATIETRTTEAMIRLAALDGRASQSST
jgi:hypothetical protein